MNTEALDTQLSEKLMKLLPELTDTQHIKLGQFIQAYVDSECLKSRKNELRIVPKHEIKTWFDFEVYRRKRMRSLNTGGNNGKS